MNEIEVRRVRNTLARVAGAAPALPPEELAAIAARARSAPVAADRRTRATVTAAAVALVAVAAGTGVIAVGDRDRRSETTAGTTLVTFPEGSAVHLLTSNAERGRAR